MKNNILHRESVGHLFLFLFLLYSTATPAVNDSPQSLVEGFHDTLLEVMQNAESLGFKGRHEKLAPVIKAGFDTPLISKVILGRYWNELGDDQQGRFIELFNELSISTYASRFDSYSGETFRTLGLEELKKGRMLVKTELVKNSDKPVKFEYLVQQKDGIWYIISVIANGVNDLSIKRHEYETIISERGYDGLIQDIENKISELKKP